MIKEKTSTFGGTPHTVISKDGSDVNVRNDETGQQYRRNIVHLKKVEGKWVVCSDEGGTLDKENDSPVN